MPLVFRSEIIRCGYVQGIADDAKSNRQEPFANYSPPETGANCVVDLKPMGRMPILRAAVTDMSR